MSLMDTHYLVIRHDAGDDVRRLAGTDLRLHDIRSAACGALRGAAEVARRRARWGDEVTYLTTMWGRPVRLTVVLAAGPDGKPRTAPDGRKHLAFLLSVRGG